MAKKTVYKQQAQKQVKNSAKDLYKGFTPDGWGNVAAILQGAGWTQSAATPASPGVRKYTDPFKTADDFFAENAQKDADAKQRQQIDNDLSVMKENADQSRLEIDDAYKKNTSATIDDMIGRGLFQSSIKDAALYDVQAQKTMQDTFLTTQFNNAVLRGQTMKDQLDEVMRVFKEDMDRKMVQNASAVDSGSEPQYSVAPNPGSPGGQWQAPTLQKPTVQHATFAPVKTAPAVQRPGSVTPGKLQQNASFKQVAQKGVSNKLAAPKAPTV